MTIPRQGAFTPEWPQEEQHSLDRLTSPAGEPGTLAGAHSSHYDEIPENLGIFSHRKSCALRTALSREARGGHKTPP